MTTHKPTANDTIFLLQGLGSFALLLSVIIALNPSYIFTYSIPLGLSGATLLLLPLSDKFQKIMRLDVDKGSKKAPGENGSRQARRAEQRMKRKMK